MVWKLERLTFANRSCPVFFTSTSELSGFFLTCSAMKTGIWITMFNFYINKEWNIERGLTKKKKIEVFLCMTKFDERLMSSTFTCLSFETRRTWAFYFWSSKIWTNSSIFTNCTSTRIYICKIRSKLLKVKPTNQQTSLFVVFQFNNS